MHKSDDEINFCMVSLHEDTYIPYIACGELLACGYNPFEAEAWTIHEGLLDSAVPAPAKAARWRKCRQSCLLV